MTPDAKLGCQREGEKRKTRGVSGRPVLLPNHTEFPRMLRQARVGDLVAGGIPGRGPEVTWVGQG